MGCVSRLTKPKRRHAIELLQPRPHDSWGFSTSTRGGYDGSALYLAKADGLTVIANVTKARRRRVAERWTS